MIWWSYLFLVKEKLEKSLAKSLATTELHTLQAGMPLLQSEKKKTKQNNDNWLLILQIQPQ